MSEPVAEATGWMLDKQDAVVFLVVWAVIVLVYGLWRSRGEARPDPIRRPGPLVE